MEKAAYLSTIHPAWTLERQRATVGLQDAEYVDEFGSSVRNRMNPEVLIQRAALLHSTSECSPKEIEVASPACFAFTVADFTSALAALSHRDATITFKDIGLTIQPSPETPKLAAVIELFQSASRQRGLHRSREEIAREREADTRRRIKLIAEDWARRDHSTRELLARAGVKPGKPMAPATAVAHLGSRPKAQKE